MKKKGFTLVEVIISIILVSVVLVSLLATLVKLRETYSVIHENSDVIVYSSSIARVINNDFVINNGIRYVECDSQGKVCDMVLGNDERRRLEIREEPNTRTSRTADKENSLKVVINNRKTSLVYWNTSPSEKSGNEEDKELIYIKTLEQESSTSYEKDPNTGRDTDKVHLTRTDGYAFEYMMCEQIKYDDVGASSHLVDLMTSITIKVDDGSKAGTNKYDIKLYASGRYDESKIIGQRYTIALDYGENVTSTGTTSIDEVYGVAYYVYNPSEAKYERKDDIVIPKRPNYAFLGYFYKKNGTTTEQQVIDSTGRIMASTRTFQSDVVKDSNGKSEVYAKYHNCTSTPGYQIQSDGTCVPKEYTVRLAANGGSGGTASYKVYYQALVKNVSIPKKTGHVLNGFKASNGKFYHDKLGKGLLVFDFTSDQTFTADWKKCPAGTFANQTTSTCDKCPEGTYSAGGVNSCTLCPAGSYAGEKGSAACTPCAIGTYSIGTGNRECKICVSGSYQNNTGKTECIPCTSGRTTSLPGQVNPSACSTCPNSSNVSGWKETKWNTNNSMSNLCSINGCSTGYTLKSNECKPNAYEVKFNSNGGSGSMSNQQFLYGTSQNLKENAFSRDNYSFQGWSTSANGTVVFTNKQSVSNLATSGVYNIYAVWLGNPYTVKFNANGGSGTMTNQSFTYGTAKALNANKFTKTNYKFIGWATSSSGNVAYEDKQTVNNLIGTGTFNLYAKWQPNSKNITLNNHGATTAGSTSVNVTFDSQIPKITVPGKNGYLFTGYYSSETGGTQYIKEDGTSARVWDSASINTLHAQWRACSAGYYCPGDNTEKICSKGTYSRSGASSCTPCAVGSYQSSTGQSVCRACPNGKTTSGTGKQSDSDCTNCTNSNSVSSWKTQSWSPNTVANLCSINSCNSGYKLENNSCSKINCASDEYLDGNTCKKCSSKFNNCSKCTASACTECNDGYTLSGGNCINNKVQFSISPTGWTNGNVTVTITHNDIPSGFILQRSINGTSYSAIRNGGTYNVTSNRTIYGRLYNSTTKEVIGENSINITNIDNVAPTAPTEIEVISKTVNSMTIKAKGGTDEESGIAGYQYVITGNTTKVPSTPTSSNYTFTGLEEDVTYTIDAWSVDKVGNISSNKKRAEISTARDPNAPMPPISCNFTMAGWQEQTKFSFSGAPGTTHLRVAWADQRIVYEKPWLHYVGTIKVNDTISTRAGYGTVQDPQHHTTYVFVQAYNENTGKKSKWVRFTILNHINQTQVITDYQEADYVSRGNLNNYNW